MYIDDFMGERVNIEKYDEATDRFEVDTEFLFRLERLYFEAIWSEWPAEYGYSYLRDVGADYDEIVDTIVFRRENGWL